MKFKIQIKHRWSAAVIFEREDVEAESEPLALRQVVVDAVATDADLAYANLAYADLAGQKIVDSGLRSDGYRFYLTGFEGEGWRIKAGCRDFSLADAQSHWTSRRGGTQLGEETFAIIRHMVALAQIRGWEVAMPEASTAEQAA